VVRVTIGQWELDDFDGTFSPMAFGPMGSLGLNRHGGTDDIEIEAEDENAPVMFVPLEAMRRFAEMCDTWIRKGAAK
jgi:hypothetical protein